MPGWRNGRRGGLKIPCPMGMRVRIPPPVPLITSPRTRFASYREGDISGLLENVVFLELLRRGYKVNIGKLGDKEVDFIATREKEKIYIQVVYLLESMDTVEREFNVLLQIPDNYPKYVLSMDTSFGGDFKGIERLNVVDFLSSE